MSIALFASVPLVEPKQVAFSPGDTLADIARALGVPPRFWTEGAIFVGGARYDSETWERTRPKAGQIVQLSLAPAGGGGDGGNKNILATIASVLLVVATTAISFGALGPAGLGLLGASFGAGGIGASALAAIVGIGGELTINEEDMR